MFKNIIVPTDLSERSLRFIEIATKMGITEGCKVTLIHVIETMDDSDDEAFTAFYERLRSRAKEKMDETANRFGKQKAGIHKEIVF